MPKVKGDNVLALPERIAEQYKEFLAALERRGGSSAPQTNVLTIENSEHKQTIFNCLINNWSPARTHTYLIRTAGVSIPVDAIKEYREQLDETDFLPITYLQSKFREIDIEVDAIGELARLLKLKAERLDTALFIESVTRPLLGIVDQQFHEYWDLLKQYVTIQKGLGFFTVDTTPVQDLLPVGTPPSEIPTIRALLEIIPAKKQQRSDMPDVIDAVAIDITEENINE